jgi:predicted metal-dependent phosphotriesterase family hydrolase
VSRPIVRTVLGDRAPEVAGLVYAHEHLIIDSPLIADRFPHIHLHDCDAAVAEVAACRTAGVALMVDAMPVCAGLGPDIVDAIMRDNAVRALTWRDGGERGFDPNLNRSERSDLS